MRPIVFAISIVIYFFSVGVLIGPATVGTITGIARDTTGAVLPGAVPVIVTNQATNISRNVVTGQDGNYTVPDLNACTYTVAASLSSFKRFDHRRHISRDVLHGPDRHSTRAGGPYHRSGGQKRVRRWWQKSAECFHKRDRFGASRSALNIRGSSPCMKWIWVAPRASREEVPGAPLSTLAASHTSTWTGSIPTLPRLEDQLGDLNPQQEAIQEVRFEYFGAKAETAESANVTDDHQSGGNQVHRTASVNVTAPSSGPSSPPLATLSIP